MQGAFFKKPKAFRYWAGGLFSIYRDLVLQFHASLGIIKGEW